MSRLAAIALGAALLVSASAALAAEVAPEVQSAIRSALTAKYPDVPVQDVRETPLPGIYEVFSGEHIAYTDARGAYLMLGPLVEVRTGTNLTDESLGARTAIDFATLPLDQAIRIVKGTGRRKLAVFADPDCPFCRQLENDLADVTDLTMYVFLLPLTALHPDADRKARAIWCAPDRSVAWQEWMSEASKLPPDQPCATAPFAQIQSLVDKLGIDSTPTLFTGTGRRINGVLPRDQLERLLSDGKTETARN